ncbi:hypothetical protein SAMN05192563_105247 [Paraburkholderia aspalathi]|uniref:Uncharacterized protein n=2 Tax=Paraburkholderia aspalathi TaxID=1324617 RepID=A0A1I7ER27_9BURK|nr:hypothetical protein SAMN05192563_105247 [Paraburkholderia aspalathi]
MLAQYRNQPWSQHQLEGKSDLTELVIVSKIPMHFHRTFKFQHPADNWLERAVCEIRDTELCRDHSACVGVVDS